MFLLHVKVRKNYQTQKMSETGIINGPSHEKGGIDITKKDIAVILKNNLINDLYYTGLYSTDNSIMFPVTEY